MFRIADVASDPLKVEVLKADLAQQMGLASDGKTLTVLNWSIYYNKQTQKHAAPCSSSVGIQGYSDPRQEEREGAGQQVLARRNRRAAGTRAAKSRRVYFPLISEFEGTFGGKPFNVRVVHSPRRKTRREVRGRRRTTRDELLEAVHKTAEALATAIVQ